MWKCYMGNVVAENEMLLQDLVKYVLQKQANLCAVFHLCKVALVGGWCWVAVRSV